MDYINLNKLILKNNSNLLQILPKFCIYFLKLIIREKEINKILTKYSHYEGIEFLSKIIEELNIKVEIDGIDNLPENGKCFFVANHPFGFIDGLILTYTIGKKYGDFRAIGNEYFLLIPHLKSKIAAVNVFGTNPKNYTIELQKLFASNLPITHFPAGLVSRVKKRQVEDPHWKKSFIKQAVNYQRDIIPFYFYGRNSYLFYFIYVVRKALRIKATIELAILPHEIFNKRNKTIHVKIGKAILYSTFDKSKSNDEWAQYVKQQVYNQK